MEKELVFHILEIEPTKEEAQIRSAYLTLLKKTNPEDDPEGFKRLREAYEEALSLARETEEEENVPLDDIGFWLNEVDTVYQDIEKRSSTAEWEALISSPVCEDLDTSLDARNRLLGYLMDHFQLPQEIWILLDKSFQLVEDMEQLSQQFPEGFLSYVKSHTENPSFLPYHLFTVRDRNTMNADAYIKHFFDLMHSTDEGTLSESWKLLDEMKAFGLYHPYEDIEKMRLLLAEKRIPEAASLANELKKTMPDDTWLFSCLAELNWAQENYDEAHDLWQKVLYIYPRQYRGNCGVIRYYIQKAEYTKAKDLIIKMLDEYGYNEDEQLMAWMDTANKALIAEIQSQLDTLEPESHLFKEQFLELGWCLFQNSQEEKAIEMLEDFCPDADQCYTYENLFGRLLARKEYYDRALPHLKEWLSLIKQTTNDGSEENAKRLSRESLACQIISSCLKGLKQFEEGETYLNQAISSANDPGEELSCRQQLAALLFAAGQYERCIDICDKIIQEADNYFPAYVQRQEAAFELKRGQQVVDDYYNAINIYPGWYKPYLLAAQVFFYFDQYKDAKGVLDRARENQVIFSDRMKLFEIKILRNLAENNDDREEPKNLCRTLIKEVNPEDTDIEDLSELSFELSLLFWDDNDYESALPLIDTAISENRERLQYHLIKGHYYRDMKKYKEALKEYETAKPDYEKAATLYYNKGICYEALECYNLARECFEETLSIEDGYSDTYERLANLSWDDYGKYFRPSDYEKAIFYMDKQVSLDPCCYYLVHRGRIHMDAMELELAIADFEKALEDRPDDWAAFNNLGYCYRQMGNLEKAIEMFQKSIQCFTDRKSVLPYSNMADCYEIMGDYKTAAECYLKDLEWFPDRASFWSEVGDMYTYLGEYEKAEDAYNHDKESEKYLPNLGDIWYLKGDIKKAVSYYKKNLDKQAESHKKLGDLYDRLGDLKKAADCFKKAISRLSNDHELFTYEEELAVFYYRMKKFGKARDLAKKALEHFKKSENGTIEDYLSYRALAPARKAIIGMLYLCLGETTTGLSYINEMDSGYLCKSCRHKGCFEKYLYLGFYYETNDQMEKALECYEKAVSLAPNSLWATGILKNFTKKRK